MDVDNFTNDGFTFGFLAARVDAVWSRSPPSYA